MIGKIQLPQVKNSIQSSRVRKNILKELEKETLTFLCKWMPKWITPDILTGIGVLGSAMVALSLFYSVYNRYFLIMTVLGFAVQWFGDSLDGRLAYYRNTPRKWYGWALDLNADWISISLIGLGFYSYLPQYKFLAFIFVLGYGGSMILSLMRYKLNNKYVIDKGRVGPTEMRIIICTFLIVELFITNTLIAFCSIGSFILIVMNIYESKQILDIGDIKDKLEKQYTSPS